jgi:hypothetical protein
MGDGLAVRGRGFGDAQRARALDSGRVVVAVFECDADASGGVEAAVEDANLEEESFALTRVLIVEWLKRRMKGGGCG